MTETSSVVHNCIKNWLMWLLKLESPQICRTSGQAGAPGEQMIKFCSETGPENKDSQCCSSSLKASRAQDREEPMRSLNLEAREKLMS